MINSKLKDTLINGIKEQHFTDLIPGSVVREIDVLLKKISETKFFLTPTKVSIVTNLLPALNESLANPHKVVIPEKVSTNLFPNLKGLFLLLRASNLTQIELGKPPLLAVNENHYSQWKKLNDAEKYAWLLESWLLRGHPEIIGNKDELWLSTMQWLSFGVSCSKNDWTNVDGNKYLNYSPGYVNLALMKLFGLATIIDNVSESQAWNVEKVTLTPFGKLFFILYASENNNYDAIAEPEKIIGIIRKCHPEIKNGIVEAKSVNAKGSYTFNVKVCDCRQKMEVPVNFTLHQFLNQILKAYNFDNDHLYEFRIKNGLGVTETYVHPSMDDDEYYADEHKIGSLSLKISQEFKLVYDFGDNWRFGIKLESTNPESKIKECKILEKKGNGPDQYQDLSF